MLAKKDLFKKYGDKIQAYLNSDLSVKLDEETQEAINKINKKGIIDIPAFFEGIVDKFTKSPMEIDVEDVEREINSIIQND